MNIRFFIAALAEIHPDPLSAEIQRECKTDWSHIGNIVEIENEKPLLYHATRIGFHEEPLEHFLPGHIIRRKIEMIPKDDFAKGLAYGWLLGCIGTEYGFAQLPGIKWKWLRKMPILKHFVKNKRASVICCESALLWLGDCFGIEDPSISNSDFSNVRDPIRVALKNGGVEVATA